MPFLDGTGQFTNIGCCLSREVPLTMLG
jgi:hypothetical protein